MKSGIIKAALLFMVIVFTLLIGGCNAPSKEGAALESGFINPGESAKPRVWWHWMNGNITKQGIRKDLEWMHRAGIGGFQNFDAALMTPQIVEKRLIYMTPEWKDAFRFTTVLADSLSLEMAIAGSPGWSESGGPWVKPEQAMKKFVWSETRVVGGKTFKGILPAPPSTTGPFQNLGMKEAFSLSETKAVPDPAYYADAAVVAFKLSDSDLPIEALNPKVTSSGGKFDLKSLTDGDLVKSTMLPHVKPGEKAWIQYEFPQPETMSAVSVVGGGYEGMFGFGADVSRRTLESSNDGKTFETVTEIIRGGVEQKTLSFDPVTAKYFRFTWETPMPAPAFNIGAAFGFGDVAVPKGPSGTNIAELVLYRVPRVNRFEEKAAFSAASDLYSAPTPALKDGEAIKKADVVDLTASMKPDGSIEWTAPAGNWVIMRMGYSLTGHKNSPASPEATGLEVDKLNAKHVKDYFTTYLDQYKDATGGLMGDKGLKYMITDSWEAGTQNWTDDMKDEFTKRRGYDITPWLPVLAGHIVESAEASDRFLWDFRKTLSDLVTDNHYDQLTDILKERGMARYSESHESGRAFIGDGMEAKRRAAIPMSATWTPGGLNPGTEVATGYKADVRESASTAHIYGQNLVAAESMTAIGSAWAWSPELLKPTADMEMANGLNRFVIHTSVHQPVDDKIPGLGLGPFGQWFTRHETWAEQAGPWIKYLTRSCYMLQQGKFVADIVWYYGEDNNITSLYNDKLPDVPEGYNYDFINSDALINLLAVNNGAITTPSGMSYRVLALDENSRYMSLNVIRKIRDMVNNGAIIVGNKPFGSPGNSDDQAEFKTIADQLWANEKGENIIGKGKVYAGETLLNVMNTLNIAPDFTYTKPAAETNLLFVHRKLAGVDFYWINSRNANPQDVDATFRESGREAEVWRPETGKIEKVSYSMENGVTKVPLHLESNDAVFVVFRDKTGRKSYEAPKPEEKQLAAVEGPWNVKFQEKRGAPAEATFDKLGAWNENADNGIKYFSGTATYTKSVNIAADWLNGGKICLDLGDVQNLAQVLVNGNDAGIVWKKPFRIDISGALKEGDNTLEIRITNLWVNRLVGDAQPGVKEKITYTTMPFYRAESPLKPSGLMGPVKLVQVMN